MGGGGWMGGGGGESTIDKINEKTPYCTPEPQHQGSKKPLSLLLSNRDNRTQSQRQRDDEREGGVGKGPPAPQRRPNTIAAPEGQQAWGVSLLLEVIGANTRSSIMVKQESITITQNQTSMRMKMNLKKTGRSKLKNRQ